MTVIAEDPKDYPIARNLEQDLVYEDPKNNPITDEPNKDPTIDKKSQKSSQK